MNTSFRESIVQLQEAESITAVTVADMDGATIGYAADRSEDLGSLTASASGIYSFLSTL